MFVEDVAVGDIAERGEDDVVADHQVWNEIQDEFHEQGQGIQASGFVQDHENSERDTGNYDPGQGLFLLLCHQRLL